MDGAQVVQEKDPKQVQSSLTGNFVLETEQTHQGSNIKVSDEPSVEQQASVSLSENVNPNDSQGPVASYPQTQDTSDVTLSNNAKVADSQKEENKSSPSITLENSNSLSQKSQGGSPEHVQQNNISDEPAPQQDTLLESTTQTSTKESTKSEFPESIQSSNLEEKENRISTSSKGDGSVGSEHAQVDNVVSHSSPLPKVTKTVARHQRKSSGDVPQAVHHRRNSSDDVSRALAAAAIDTAAPIESVRDAVSKFGGITNWKAHKVRSMERRKLIEEELEKVQEEIPIFKQKSESAEESKKQTLKELDNTKRLIEEFKLNFERAQTEERQAKQDSELAKLRVEEMEQGIAHEASVAAKAQLEVEKARNLAVVTDLKSLKDELETLQKEYAAMINDRDAAVKKADEAVSASKEVEKTIENLTVELLTTKESLESAHAARLEEEEHRTGAAKAQEQDILNQEEELKQAEEELQNLKQKILSAKDLKSKLDTASGLLQDVKAELASYMDLKLKSETAEGILEGHDGNTDAALHAAIASVKKNLEEVRVNTEKANNEVNMLKETTTSLKSLLESERSALETIKQREEMILATVASIEAEVNSTKEEISRVVVKEREAREEMVTLPKQLQKAAEEADQAKALAKTAHEELQKAEEEVDQAKTRASTTEGKLFAANKEIETAKAAEKLALITINALQETKAAQTPHNEDSTNGTTLTLEEYYELSKQAHEAEVQADMRVTKSVSHIEVAQESESRSLSKLENVTSELANKKEAFKIAKQRADKATVEKLSVEQELRKWRSKHEQQRKTSESSAKQNKSPRASSGATHSSTEVKKKKKKSVFPRFFMFLGKMKPHSKGH